MRVRNLGVLIFLALSIVSCSKNNDGWKGSVEIVDGVTIVKNPMLPIYNEDEVKLTENLSINNSSESNEFLFEKISEVAVNQAGDIYVLDYQAKDVKVFDNQGNYIRTIGGPGEGPGEFIIPRFIICSKQDQFIVGDMNRISYFSLDGEFQSSESTKGRLMISDVDSHGNIIATEIVPDKMVYELKIFDQKFNYITSFGSSPLPDFAQTGKVNPFFSVIRSDVVNGDQVVTGYADEGYILNVYDSAGQLQRKIEKEYSSIEITQNDIDEGMKRFSSRPDEEYKGPKIFPPFRRIIADDEGRIWVYTFEKAHEGGKSIFEVFDKEGKFIFRIAIKTRPLVIKNNQIYTIEEDDKGYEQVKRYILEIQQLKE